MGNLLAPVGTTKTQIGKYTHQSFVHNLDTIVDNDHVGIKRILFDVDTFDKMSENERENIIQCLNNIKNENNTAILSQMDCFVFYNNDCPLLRITNLNADTNRKKLGNSGEFTMVTYIK